jgi:hypothetical protein
MAGLSAARQDSGRFSVQAVCYTCILTQGDRNMTKMPLSAVMPPCLPPGEPPAPEVATRPAGDFIRRRFWDSSLW